ncbi:MAG: hypothetical protein ACLUSP_07890 [Christensenellales bacterium]
MLLSFGVSAINLVIGAIYGTIEGYYGGTTDLIMERIVDILAGLPFIVVATLFQLHLAKSAGVLGSLLFSFILTGWIGTARRVRTQFYRFKIRNTCLRRARSARATSAYVQAYFPQHARHDYHLVRSRYPQRYFLRVHAVLPRHCQPRRHHDHEYRRNARTGRRFFPLSRT